MRHANNTFAPSTAHRDKRQFQPSITSFFFREESYSGDDEEEAWEERGSGPITRQQHHHHPSERALRDSLAPSNLPHSVQADLLSVGMRVRKSVPEGYKTSKTVTLPTIQTTLSKTHYVNTHSVAVNTGAGDAYSVKPPRDPVPDAFQHQRELLPFCGLHKIGGFAEQPVTNVHLYGGADANGDRPVNIFPLPAEAFNQPFSSQDSLSSVTTHDSLPHPNSTNPHKRSWQDPDEDVKASSFNANFVFALPMKVAEDEVPVSPLSATPSQSITSLPQSALRPFAQPKTRRHGTRLVEVEGVIFKDADIDMDVENAELSDMRGPPNPNDFGEAEFLRPWSAREVEMGGV